MSIIILTDVVLICSSNDKSTKLMKELTLIRAPIRTDKINPIKSDNRIHLLVMSDYGCPENCFTLDFKNILVGLGLTLLDVRVSSVKVIGHFNRELSVIVILGHIFGKIIRSAAKFQSSTKWKAI